MATTFNFFKFPSKLHPCNTCIVCGCIKKQESLYSGVHIDDNVLPLHHKNVKAKTIKVKSEALDSTTVMSRLQNELKEDGIVLRKIFKLARQLNFKITWNQFYLFFTSSHSYNLGNMLSMSVNV